MHASRRGICKFLHRYTGSGTIHRMPGSGLRSKTTEEVRQIVEEQMRKDDETTAVQLRALLLDKGYQLSLRTILRCRAGSLLVGHFEAVHIANLFEMSIK